MNWLFCCGDKTQATKEGGNTLDLSKPMLVRARPLEEMNKEDMEGLSGKQNAESKLLNALISGKKQKP